jgi:hypothetical protein
MYCARHLLNKGWSTWCTENDVLPCYDDFCNEQEIRSVADAMAANGLKDLGYNYIVLDDCCAPPPLLLEAAICLDHPLGAVIG